MKALLEHVIQSIPENNRAERIWKIAQVDFRRRYYNDKLGLFWALLNPLFKVLLYYIVFTKIMNRGGHSTDNYALFLFSALIFWMSFSELINKGTRILSQKGYLVENIKINKLDLFLSHGLSSFMGFSFNLFIYMIAAAAAHSTFSASILLMPVLILTVYLLGLGLAMLMTILLIFLKDTDHILDLGLQLGFWSSGIFFPAEQIISFWAPMYYLNPFVGIFHNVRAIALYDSPVDYHILLINFICALFFYSIGLFTLKKYGHLHFERLTN